MTKHFYEHLASQNPLHVGDFIFHTDKFTICYIQVMSSTHRYGNNKTQH